MADYVDPGYRTFVAGGALGRHLRVKLTTGKLALAGVGATDNLVELGTLEDAAFADGDVCNVSLRNKQGTVKMVAGGSITAGASVYGAANGKISTTASGSPLGIALTGASGDNSIIEVLRFY